MLRYEKAERLVSCGQSKRKGLFVMENYAPKMCPHCNVEMIREIASYPMGSALMKERFHVDIYRCPKCDRVKLFAAESKMVTCPVCGTVHPASEGCIVCALNGAFTQQK